VKKQVAGHESGQARKKKLPTVRVRSTREALRLLRATKRFAQMMVGRERRARLASCGNNLDRDVLKNDIASRGNTALPVAALLWRCSLGHTLRERPSAQPKELVWQNASSLKG
jgi:hypothetical protein